MVSSFGYFTGQFPKEVSVSRKGNLGGSRQLNIVKGELDKTFGKRELVKKYDAIVVRASNGSLGRIRRRVVSGRF
jgi:hypothetical protein